MPTRPLLVLATFAAVAIALVLDPKEHWARLMAPNAAASQVSAHAGRDKKPLDVAVATIVGPPARKGFSQKQYDLLWQRYKPVSGLANGPMSEDRLDNLAAIVKNNTQDKKWVPVFEDVIYGRSAALENRLDTGLSANTTIYLEYPYSAPVSLLDMAIKAGQRDLIGVLLRHKASVAPLTEVAPDGTSLKVEAPLPIAAGDGEDDVVLLLLQKGSNIEQGRALQTNNETALNAAVTMQNVSTAYLLLTHGADVNSALGPGGTVPPLLTPSSDSPPQINARVIALRDLLIQYGAKMPSAH